MAGDSLDRLLHPRSWEGAAMNVAAWLEKCGRSHAARPGIARGDAVHLSFADWAARVRRIAGGLLTLGCRPGDRVAITMTNCAEFLEAEFSALHARPCSHPRTRVRLVARSALARRRPVCPPPYPPRRRQHQPEQGLLRPRRDRGAPPTLARRQFFRRANDGDAADRQPAIRRRRSRQSEDDHLRWRTDVRRRSEACARLAWTAPVADLRPG